jgi:YYY domain-containing protein
MIPANFSGLYVVIWWIIVQLLGWLALPVAYRLFRWLPDRGYAFSKALGLLMVSYLLWLGSITGFLHNSRGGLAIAILLAAGFSAWIYFRRRPAAGDEPTLRDFLREHKGMIISVELLFAAGFILWAVLRAYASFKIDTAGGEKFMEIAFLNAIQRSVSFPPLDPWLSGFSISYYYFGYVMMAVMTRLSGAPAGVAFDLYDALLFALTLVGAFGVVYNLVPAARRPRTGRPSFGSGQPIRYALLGALLVAVMGNLSGFVQSIYSTGLISDSFWKWLNAPNLVDRAEKTGTLVPTDTGWFWWWQGSRVVADRDLLGNSDFINPAITEFPFFSFLLGDNHPHVLALPFVLMAIGLGLNLLRRETTKIHEINTKGDVKENTKDADQTEAHRLIQPEEHRLIQPPWWNPIAYCLDGDAFLFVMTAFILGALGFLNTWDFPIYLVLAALAYGAGLYASQHAGTTRRPDGLLVRRTLSLGIGLGVLAVLLYILFYLGFSSQAAGILPFIFPPTQLRQYFVMFGPFLFILSVFLAVYLLRSARYAGRQALGKTLLAWLGTALALLGVYALMLLSLSLLDLFLHLTKNGAIQKALSGLSATAALGKALSWRLRDPWLLLWLSGLITFAMANLVWHVRTATATPVIGGEGDPTEPHPEKQPAAARAGQPSRGGSPAPRGNPAPRLSPSVLFVFLLIFLGVALTFSVEFVFLRDNFGNRMNTIFKFYYQGWVMMACASAYAVWWLLNRGDKVIGAVGKYIFLGLAGVFVAAGLFYTVFSFDNRVQGFKGVMKPNLDGTSVLAQRSPDDWAAITWLNQNVSGAAVILEAPGHSYNYEGRISALTGLPAVLGWALHEDQWRGNYTEQGIREPDIAAIYTTRDDQTTLDLLHKWKVRYVILGETERNYIRELCAIPDYGCSAASASEKFDGLLPVVFSGGTMIYAVP